VISPQKDILQSPHRRRHRGHAEPSWSPYGCHYYPDPADFPEPDPATLPEEPLGAGEQYYVDLSGKIRKGPTSGGYTCYCAPMIDRVEKKMDRNKRDVIRQLDATHGRLSSRINHLERRTREQLAGLSNNMKETFAAERAECQDRMERRAIRDRIAVERQAAVRDVVLRGDLTAWLEHRVREVEEKALKQGSGSDGDAAFMRTLLRSSKRRKRAFWAELQSGTLRRAASEDNVQAEEGEQEQQHPPNSSPGYEELWKAGGEPQSLGPAEDLMVSDHPRRDHGQPDDFQRGMRVRRNSAGDENQMFCDFGDFYAKEILVGPPSDSVDPTSLNLVHVPPNDLSQMPSVQSLRVQQYNGGGHLVPPPHQHSAGSSNSAGINDVLSYSTNSESHSYHSGAPSPHFQVPVALRQHAPPVPPIKPALRDTSAIYQNFGLAMQNIQRPVPLTLSGMPPPLLPPKHSVPPPYRPPPPQQMPMRMGAHAMTDQAGHMAAPPLLGFTKTTSDGGNSHDSHNDSGYCQRIGGSGGPSARPSGAKAFCGF